VCLQGGVVLLQRGSLPLQGEDLSLLAVRLTPQLPQLGLHRLALGLKGRILERREEVIVKCDMPSAHRLV